MKKNKILIMIVVCALFLSFAIGSGSSKPTREDYYYQFIDHATNGEYQAGLDVYNSQGLKDFVESEKYAAYCRGMIAYENGGIGAALQYLLQYPDVLDAAQIIESIEAEIGSLNGIYKEDNGRGSYLYLIIEDGKVATESTGYYDEDQTLRYTEDDLIFEIVKSTFTTGEVFYAVGRYQTYTKTIEIDYVMTIYDDENEIMLVAPEGAEFTTFNGLYEKIS